MTPKKQAKELVDKFMNCDNMIFLTEGAKQCALIAVDEMIKEAYFTDGYYDRQDFWEEVKQEIEKL